VPDASAASGHGALRARLGRRTHCEHAALGLRPPNQRNEPFALLCLGVSVVRIFFRPRLTTRCGVSTAWGACITTLPKPLGWQNILASEEVRVRHHEFEMEMPFAVARIWALFQRYDLWKEYAPAVLDVEIVYPGDAAGNGLLRRVIYPLPFGRRGESYELVTNVRPCRGYDYQMLRTGLSGSMSLEALGPKRTCIRFREAFHMTTPILRLFEGPIYHFINKKNEESIRGAAAWLAAHPEFHPDVNDENAPPT
jgi:hypothetical protein